MNQAQKSLLTNGLHRNSGLKTCLCGSHKSPAKPWGIPARGNHEILKRWCLLPGLGRCDIQQGFSGPASDAAMAQPTTSHRHVFQTWVPGCRALAHGPRRGLQSARAAPARCQGSGALPYGKRGATERRRPGNPPAPPRSTHSQRFQP